MLDSFLRFLEHEKRFSNHTLVSYKNDLLQFSQFLTSVDSNVNLNQVQYLHIRAWIVSLVEDDIAPKSINRKIASLRSFYKFLQKREFIDENPMQKVKALKTAKTLPHFVKEPEMVQLLDQIQFPEGFQGLRDKLIFELLYGTGMRLSELISLTPESFNNFEKTVKVLGKRNKERIIPIPDQVFEIIKLYNSSKQDHFTGKFSNFLIVTDKGKKAYPVMIYRIVKQYLNLVTTTSKKSPHVLRHTFATHLLNKGADLNAVKELLGHANLAATQIYTHNSMEKLKAAFDQAHPKA
ncbi:MAG: tyrosine-type recombinase/integrase [Cyclobacteriaceae bacterium]